MGLYKAVQRVALPIQVDMSTQPTPLRKRILFSISRVESGCWEWRKSTRGVGYGRIKVGGRCLAAHRVAYEQFKGPIPEGMKVLHRCDNRLCCNPEHLFLGTQMDNVQDALAKGRMPQLTTAWLQQRGRGY